jgi:putative Mg2+ transporter-C (MgtC) family protein
MEDSRMIWYEVVLRLILAIIVGGLIGYEREYKNRPAGFRTHILVCVGAAVTSMIQLYAIVDTANMILGRPDMADVLKADIGRLGAQVITGVGFLGAGTIIHEKGSVKGLTTAASIWVVACIGLSVGLGYYFLSVSATIGVFIVLVSLKQFETRFFQKLKVAKLEVQFINKVDLVIKMEEYFNAKNIKVQNIEFEIEEEEDSPYRTSLYTVLVPRHIKPSEIIRDLCIYEEICKVTVI